MSKVLKLNSTSYTKKSFCPDAVKMWQRYFDVASPQHDLAYWWINGMDAVVSLSGRFSSINESIVPSPTFTLISVRDYLADGAVADEEDLARFQSWVERGILEAFESDRVQKVFEDRGFGEGGFAIVTCPHDEAMSFYPVKVIWTNDDHLTSEEIMSRQKSAEKCQKRISPIKKKPVRKK